MERKEENSKRFSESEAEYKIKKALADLGLNNDKKIINNIKKITVGREGKYREEMLEPSLISQIAEIHRNQDHNIEMQVRIIKEIAKKTSPQTLKNAVELANSIKKHSDPFFALDAILENSKIENNSKYYKSKKRLILNESQLNEMIIHAKTISEKGVNPTQFIRISPYAVEELPELKNQIEATNSKAKAMQTDPAYTFKILKELIKKRRIKTSEVSEVGEKLLEMQKKFEIKSSQKKEKALQEEKGLPTLFWEMEKQTKKLKNKGKIINKIMEKTSEIENGGYELQKKTKSLERKKLKIQAKKAKNELIKNRIMEMLRDGSAPKKEIEEEIGLNETKAYNLLKEMLKDGLIKKQREDKGSKRGFINKIYSVKE